MKMLLMIIVKFYRLSHLISILFSIEGYAIKDYLIINKLHYF